MVFVTGLWRLGGALGELLDVKDVQASDWVPVFGPLSVALITIAYHYIRVLEMPALKEQEKRFETLDPPPVIEPAGPTAVVVPATVRPAARHRPLLLPRVPPAHSWSHGSTRIAVPPSGRAIAPAPPALPPSGAESNSASSLNLHRFHMLKTWL